MTLTVDFDKIPFKTTPFQHQLDGLEFLLSNLQGALFDEPGIGKSKQFIDASCTLWTLGQLDATVVVCPAGVLSTWTNLEFGQIATHSFVPTILDEFRPRTPNFSRERKDAFRFIVTNYELIRTGNWLEHLLYQLRGRRTMVVFDESSFVKSHRASQTKASFRLRRACQRAYLANGTPVVNNLIDLYGQFAVLDKGIIGSENYWAFRNRYCKMGGYQMKQIIGYRHESYLQQRLAPYIMRRLKEDCLDLPPKLYSVLEVPLSEETWKVYCQMRDDMIAWLDQQTPVMTMNAAVKIMRLSQITAGMVGGLSSTRRLLNSTPILQDFTFSEGETVEFDNMFSEDLRVLSSEKHEYCLNWFLQRCEEQPNFRCIFWTRFRAQQPLMRAMFEDANRRIETHRIYGGQKKNERDAAMLRFNTESNDPMALFGQPQAAGIGTNLQLQCSAAVYVSTDYSLLFRTQSEDRLHRPGQLNNVNIYDLLATGPKGQRTINHHEYRAIQRKDALALRTTSYWRNALKEDSIF